jgi:hypothetical protein
LSSTLFLPPSAVISPTLLRAAWSAVLEETRIMLLDLLVEVDDEAALWSRNAVNDD